MGVVFSVPRPFLHFFSFFSFAVGLLLFLPRGLDYEFPFSSSASSFLLAFSYPSPWCFANTCRAAGSSGATGPPQEQGYRGRSPLFPQYPGTVTTAASQSQRIETPPPVRTSGPNRTEFYCNWNSPQQTKSKTHTSTTRQQPQQPTPTPTTNPNARWIGGAKPQQCDATTTPPSTLWVRGVGDGGCRGLGCTDQVTLRVLTVVQGGSAACSGSARGDVGGGGLGAVEGNTWSMWRTSQ